MIKSIEEIANKLTGIPYVHNGRSYDGVDCWGVVYLFFKELDIVLPEGNGQKIEENWYKKDPEIYLRELSNFGTEVGHYKNLQPLDIPYFRLYKNFVSHTAIMLDNIHFLHVLRNKEVDFGTFERRIWKRKYAGARRIINKKGQVEY